ncbi:hypothetical protein F5883DRAFT_518930 [Diaporthe sp. PMI_573]|nr:hypothetical protein F5883DRAFT_518930 [Diaporthaceae sp. PMI_573]
MTEDFRRLKEALMRHQPVQPRPEEDSQRLPHWSRRVEILGRINETIILRNEKDWNRKPQIFEEADADDRWMDHVDEVHKRLQAMYAADAALNHVGNSGGQSAVGQQNQPTEKLVLGNSHGAAHADAGAAATPGFGHRQTRQIVQPSFSPRPITRSFRPRAKPHRSPSNQGGPSNVADTSKETDKNKNDINKEDDRNKENKRGPQSFSYTGDSSANASESSEDEDMEKNADTDEAEREGISQLFEDFPTCIQKSRNANAIDSNECGIMTISNPGSGWSQIDRAILPPRIAKYLAGFTRRDAAAFPDSVDPDLATNGEDSHRWLLATARKEFICDTSTLDVWYRSRADAQQTAPPQQPL